MVIRTVDIVNAFAEMAAKERYGEVLLMLDTCQGQALIEDVRVEGVTTLSSSLST
jgi:glycosylphosphatidylinositol transamidase (GPIT) subunit GPI8